MAKRDTNHSRAGSTSNDVYEGFFDSLSVLTYNRLTYPIYTTVVLNSANSLKQALPVLEGAKTINCYFDNDNAGRATYSKLQALHLSVNDHSNLYVGFNDLNDMIQQSTQYAKQL